MKVFIILSVILYLTLSGNVTSSWTVSSTATANSNLYNLGTLAVGDILTVSFIFPTLQPEATLLPSSPASSIPARLVQLASNSGGSSPSPPPPRPSPSPQPPQSQSPETTGSTSQATPSLPPSRSKWSSSPSPKTMQIPPTSA